MGFQKRNLSCALVIFGVVHPWVGQIRLKCNVFKTKFACLTVWGTDELRDTTPLSEATADLSLPHAGFRPPPGTWNLEPRRNLYAS